MACWWCSCGTYARVSGVVLSSMMISRFKSSVLGSQTASGKSSEWLTLGRQMLKILARSFPLRT